jgi:sensor histidine kinase YesM
VAVEPEVHPSEYFIPPMILQPFVENSVRHGLRYRKDKDGKVAVTIKKENNFLVCVLEDNGVGRKTALKYKSANPIEYQSKGMSLTAERITMLNKDNPHKITMQIDDLEDDRQNPLGTRVILQFPVL